MPDVLRETIARNIRDSRLKKFPGRGGGKRCAESFGVSPQQWSPWESGKRTPDELRLEQIATFFSTTVEWFRRDHQNDIVPAAALAYAPAGGKHEVVRTHVLGTDSPPERHDVAAYTTESSYDEDINHYLWLVDILYRKLTSSGIRIVVTFEKATAAIA